MLVHPRENEFAPEPGAVFLGDGPGVGHGGRLAPFQGVDRLEMESCSFRIHLRIIVVVVVVVGGESCFLMAVIVVRRRRR